MIQAISFSHSPNLHAGELNYDDTMIQLAYNPQFLFLNVTPLIFSLLMQFPELNQ